MSRETARSQERKPNVRAFLAGLTESLAQIQRSGIAAVSQCQETESEIRLTITIPKD